MSMTKINNGTIFIAKKDGTYEKVTEFNDISEVTIDDSDIKNTNEVWGVIDRNREVSFTCSFDPRVYRRNIRVLMGWKSRGPVRRRKIIEARRNFTRDCLLANKYIEILLGAIDVRKSKYFRNWYPIDITGLPCRDIFEWLVLCLWEVQEANNDA